MTTKQLELEVEPQITVEKGSHEFCGHRESHYEYRWNGKKCRTHVGPGLHQGGRPLDTAREVERQIKMDGGGFHTAFAVACLAGLKNGKDRALVAQWLGFDTFIDLMTHIFKIFEHHERYERKRRQLIRRVRLDVTKVERKKRDGVSKN